MFDMKKDTLLNVGNAAQTIKDQEQQALLDDLMDDMNRHVRKKKRRKMKF